MTIIGITGFLNSGKGTIADVLVQNGFKKISFADKLKDACSAIFGWDRALLEGDTTESREFRDQVDEWWATRLEKPDFTPRLALQWLGTDAGRNVFGQDLWVSALEKEITENPMDYVIPDARFSNEVRLIYNLGGTTVRVRRGPEPEWFDLAVKWNAAQNDPSNNMMMPGPLKDIHESERDWIGEKFSMTIENNGTMLEFHQTIADRFHIKNPEIDRLAATPSQPVLSGSLSIPISNF